MVESQTRSDVSSSRTRNVRLGPLERDVASAAAAAGVTVSAWLRQAVRAALPAPATAAPTHREDVDAAASRRRYVLRTSVVNAARWHGEAKAHGLSLAKYIELQMSVTPDRAHRVAAAGETVRAALVEIAAIGRNLNQLARSWNTYPGQSTEAERRALAVACDRIDRFCERLSALVGELEVRQGRRRKKDVS